MRRLSLLEPGYLGEMVAEHRAIVAAVAAHDAERAEPLCAITFAWSSRAFQARAAHPDYFEES